MPHALIPDGFTLKKVTKSEERAVNNKRRHDNVQALLENPATLAIITTSVATIAGGILIDKFVSDANINIEKSALEKAKQAALATSFIPQNLLIAGLTSGLRVAGVDSKELEKAEQAVRDLIPGL